MTATLENPAEKTATMGALIRHRRRQAGLTIAEMAVKASMSKPYLSLIETDNCRPPSDRVIRSICGVLGLDAEEMRARKYLASIPRELWSRVARMIEEE